MCLILYTTKKIGLPDDATLRRMFTGNPDGAGMVAVYHNKSDHEVYTSMMKGIMTEHNFMANIKASFALLTEDTDYIIAHTRIATSGGKAPERTHPFKTAKGGYLFHNGVCSAVLGKLRPNQSDTEYLAENFTSMTDLTGIDNWSRYVYVTPSGKPVFAGAWVTDKDGRRWSNSSYIGYTHGGYYGGYDNWYDNDDYTRRYAYGSSYEGASYYMTSSEVAAFHLMCAESPEYAAMVYNLMEDMHITYRKSGGFFFRGSEIEFNHPIYEKNYIFTASKAYSELNATDIVYSVENGSDTIAVAKFDVYRMDIASFLLDILSLTLGKDTPSNYILPTSGVHDLTKEVPVLNVGYTASFDSAYIKKETLDFTLTEINRNLESLSLPFQLRANETKDKVIIALKPEKKEQKVESTTVVDDDDPFDGTDGKPKNLPAVVKVFEGKTEDEITNYIKARYTKEYGLNAGLTFSSTILQDKETVQIACFKNDPETPTQHAYTTKTAYIYSSSDFVDKVVLKYFHDWSLK